MADTTIEKLQIEVESSSKSAATGIDALTATLEKLKNAVKGGAGLNTLSKRLSNLNTTLSSLSNGTIAKIDKLNYSLNKLSSLGQLKISPSVATQLTNIGSAVRTLDGVNFSPLSNLTYTLAPLSTLGKANLNSFITQLAKLPPVISAVSGTDFSSFSSDISELVYALASLSRIGKNNLTSFITQLSKIPTLMISLRSVDIDELADQIQDLADAFDPLAIQMQHISSGFSSFPARIQKLITSTNNLTNSNNRASKSYVNLAAKMAIAVTSLRTTTRVIGSWILKSNKYIEDINLFTVSMGEYAEEAQRYAEKVGEVMGIDPGEWMRNQGTFMTLATGFGVTSDRAEIISRNLTQLGYDISSFFNISYEDAMAKLQSGLAGELEPLRRIGYDLSVARLQEEAYRLGINKRVQAMTQAEKAELRFYAMLTQNTAVQGDMARTLEAPANQLRVLKAQADIAARALGNIFIPALNAILPYAIAVVKIIRILANEIARLANFELPEVDYSGIKTITGSGVEDTLDNAAEKAKELKNNLLGIDELNIISKEDSTGFGDLDLGSGLGFELPEYDFLGDAINDKVNEIMAELQPFINWVKNNFDEISKTAAAIGAAILAWKVAKFVNGLFNAISTLKEMKTLVGLIEFTIGGALIWDGWKLLNDDNPLNDLTGILKTIFGGILIADSIKRLIGGQKGILVSRVFTIAFSAYLAWESIQLLKDANPENDLAGVLATVFAFTTAGFTVGNLIFKSAIGGVLTASIGLAVAIGGLQILFPEQWDNAMTQISDWVNKVFNVTTTPDDITTAINIATIALFGITTLVGILNKIGMFKNIDTTTPGEVIGKIDDGMWKVNSKLTTLAKNLGAGLLIIGEVVLAAGIIADSIWGMGILLDKVGDAWQPVIDNGEIIAIAIGVGVGLLTGIGIAAASLGNISIGTAGTLPKAIGVGTGILVELGLATGLFILEVEKIGTGLDDVGQAWQPVIDKKGTIAIAIGLGAGVLTGIGLVTAALGDITIGTAGALPIAIGIGTGVLAELGLATGLFIIEVKKIGQGLDDIGQAWQPVLDNGDTIRKGIVIATGILTGVGIATAALGAITIGTGIALPAVVLTGAGMLELLTTATISFIDNIADVANEMNNNLSPVLVDFNAELPTLSTNMSNFVDYMTEFAGHVVAFAGVNIIAGLAATVDTIIGWFTKDPLEKMSDDVEKIYSQSYDLNQNLIPAIHELQIASELLVQYQTFISKIEELTNNDNSGLSNGVFIDMKDVGLNLVLGFVKGIELKSSDFKKAGKDIMDGFEDNVNDTKTQILNNFKNYSSEIVDAFRSTAGVKDIVEQFKDIGGRTVDSFKTKILNYYPTSKPSVITWAKDIKNWFGDIVSKSAFEGFALVIIDGFQNRISDYYNVSKTSVIVWGTSVVSWFKEKVSSVIFVQIATEIVDAFNDRIKEYYKTSEIIFITWAVSIKRWFNDNVSYYDFYYMGENLAQGFIDSIIDSESSSHNAIEEWAQDIIDTAMDTFDINSPSKIFYSMGLYDIQGFNNSIIKEGQSSKRIIQTWANSLTKVNPSMVMTVDTSQLKYYDSNSFARAMTANVSTASRITVETETESMETAMLNALVGSGLVADVRRQADKQEKTTVQIGNRVITDAVTTQQKANGYQFVKQPV